MVLLVISSSFAFKSTIYHERIVLCHHLHTAIFLFVKVRLIAFGLPANISANWCTKQRML